MFTKIGEERAFDAILGQIIDHIQTGELKAGDALPAERTMAESMGVSRPAVREVLRALELLGIVKSVPGGGNYITDRLDTWLIGPLSLMFRLNNGNPGIKEMHAVGCGRAADDSGQAGCGRAGKRPRGAG